MPPNIIDADHDTQPIGSKRNDIVMPAGFQVPHGISAGSQIRDTNFSFRVIESENSLTYEIFKN